jgi:CysZ protein
MLIDSLRGLLLPLQSVRLLFRPGLRRYVLVPLGLNTLLFALAIYLAATQFEHFMDRWLPQLAWLEFVRWLLWTLFAATFAVLVFFGFTLVANLLGAPFNALLAARVEQMLTGAPPPDAPTSILGSIAPALAAELGKILYLLSRALPLLLLFLIPGLNLLAPVAWLAFGFWFLAVEYFDYPMGNHDLRPGEQRRRLRARRLESLAFGAGVTLLMLIPVLQLAAMPAAVAAATRMWVDDLRGL